MDNYIPNNKTQLDLSSSYIQTRTKEKIKNERTHNGPIGGTAFNNELLANNEFWDSMKDNTFGAHITKEQNHVENRKKNCDRNMFIIHF